MMSGNKSVRASTKAANTLDFLQRFVKQDEPHKVPKQAHELK